MGNIKKRIAWIDDSIDTPILEMYIDEFENNGIEIVKIRSVVGVIETLKNEVQNSLSAILVDIIMPSEDLDFGETRGGLRTGMVVLKKIANEDLLNNVPRIVVTNADDIEVMEYCEQNHVPYLKKYDFFADTFVKSVKEVVDNYENKDENEKALDCSDYNS